MSLQPILLLLAKTNPRWHLLAVAFERLRSTDLENPHCNHNLAKLWAEAFDQLDYIWRLKPYLSAPPKIWFCIKCVSEQGHQNRVNLVDCPTHCSTDSYFHDFAFVFVSCVSWQIPNGKYEKHSREICLAESNSWQLN